MANQFDAGLNEIAALVRKAKGAGWGDYQIGIIQLIFRDWLLQTGYSFSPNEIKELLVGEVEELIQAKRWMYFTDSQRWDRAYEAADVMIYILHMFSVYGVRMLLRFWIMQKSIEKRVAMI